MSSHNPLSPSSAAAAPVAQRQRLHYVDFMKGLCILLIVTGHVDDQIFMLLGANADHALQTFRIPMYYFVSGIFFKTYGGLSDFTRRKVNNILVPLVFFYVLSYLWRVGVQLLPDRFHCYDEFSWSMLLDPLTRRSWRANPPLWFLLSLLEVNLLYYCLQRTLRRPWAVALAAVALSVMGYLLSVHHVRLLFFPETALVGLPYFVLGSAVRHHGLMEPMPADRYGPFVLVPVLALLWVVAPAINIHEQVLPGYLTLYALPALAIVTLLWACKRLPKVPLMCYWGRYSLVVLGTHFALVRPVRYVLIALLGFKSVWLSVIALAVLMLLEVPIIWLLTRYLPRVTAQRPFFYEGWCLRQQSGKL